MTERTSTCPHPKSVDEHLVDRSGPTASGRLFWSPTAEVLDASPWGGDLTEIAPPHKELLHGLIYTGAVTVLVSPKGLGKSSIARNLAHSVATGQPFLGIRTHKSRVAYVSDELVTDRVAELETRTPLGTDLVVFDHPGAAMNSVYSTGSVELMDFANRRGLAVFITTRRLSPWMTSNRSVSRWHLSLIDVDRVEHAERSYAHGRLETGDGYARPNAIPIVRGDDGKWTLDVYRVVRAFSDLEFHRRAGRAPVPTVK